MGALKLERTYTVDEYLAIERGALDRHEYLDGQIIAMAGENPRHGVISVNLVVSIGSRLKGKQCEVRTKGTKVRSGPSPRGANKCRGLYSYPDLVIICGEPEYHDAEKDVVLNPKVNIEVLSPSTENFDRGEKFRRFELANPTLTDYLLVSQDRPHVEHYVRQPNGSWEFKRYNGLNASVKISSINCSVKMKDIYDRIKFGKDKSI